MENDLPGNNPQKIWQNQTTEPPIMTSEKIRQKTQELNAKTRRELLRGISVALLVALIAVYGITRANDLLARAVFAFALVWSLAGQYFVNRGLWRAELPGEAAFSTGLGSYRHEVERRRAISSRFLLWSFGPVVLAIGALILLLLSFGMKNRGMLLEGTLVNMTPFLALVVIWIIGVFVIRIRNQRDLQREIDELDAIEQANK